MDTSKIVITVTKGEKETDMPVIDFDTYGPPMPLMYILGCVEYIKHTLLVLIDDRSEIVNRKE